MAGIRPPEGSSPYRDVKHSSKGSKKETSPAVDVGTKALRTSGRWVVERDLSDSEVSTGGKKSPTEKKTSRVATKTLASSEISPASGGAGRASPSFSPKSLAQTPPPGGLSLVKVSEDVMVYSTLVETITSDESLAKSILNNPDTQTQFRQDIAPFLEKGIQAICSKIGSFKELVQYMNASPTILDRVEPIELKNAFWDFLSTAFDHLSIIKT